MNLSTRFTGAAFSLTIALSAGPSVAAAETVAAGGGTGIEITHEACSVQVSLVAQDIMLSELLQALATELQFELRFKSENDRPVSINMRKPAPQLIKVLGRNDNIMVANEPDARCEEPVDRIKTVWFLGTGPEVVYQPATVVPVYKLPETGETPTRTARISDGDDKDEKKNKQQGKSRSQMTPEERYFDKITRQNEKRYGNK